MADGLLTASNARPMLTGIAERLAAIEPGRTPARVDPALLVAPETVWESLTMPQRREALRVLLGEITSGMSAYPGPRADPTRIGVIRSTD